MCSPHTLGIRRGNISTMSLPRMESFAWKNTKKLRCNKRYRCCCPVGAACRWTSNRNRHRKDVENICSYVCCGIATWWEGSDNSSQNTKKSLNNEIKYIRTWGLTQKYRRKITYIPCVISKWLSFLVCWIKWLKLSPQVIMAKARTICPLVTKINPIVLTDTLFTSGRNANRIQNSIQETSAAVV